MTIDIKAPAIYYDKRRGMLAKTVSNNDNKSFHKGSYTDNSFSTEQRTIIEEDRLNRSTLFDPQTQFYPADLFILKGFRLGQPIWERNPRWHNTSGFFIGRSIK